MLAVAPSAVVSLKLACCCKPKRRPPDSSCYSVPTCVDTVSSATPSCTSIFSMPSTAVHAVDQQAGISALKHSACCLALRKEPGLIAPQSRAPDRQLAQVWPCSGTPFLEDRLNPLQLPWML